MISHDQVQCVARLLCAPQTVGHLLAICKRINLFSPQDLQMKLPRLFASFCQLKFFRVYIILSAREAQQQSH